MRTVLATKFEDLVSLGLSTLISEHSNLELVARDVSIDDIEAAIEEHSPSVALLNHGTLRTPAHVFRLHQSYPKTRLVVLADRPTAAECNQMLSFGATACISKDTEARDVVNAIHLASRGMHVLPGSADHGNLRVRGSDSLTRRETEVLAQLQDGATNAEIAARLAIGVETVRTHARNIYRKLGIGSRRDLVRLGREV